MRTRLALSGTAAAALLFAGIGAGDAAAQTVSPDTGAAPCTDTNIHQYTKYHGLICYSNRGKDDLTSSGFLTYAFGTPCYRGQVTFIDETGRTWLQTFIPQASLITYWPWSPKTGVVSIIKIEVDDIVCS